MGFPTREEVIDGGYAEEVDFDEVPVAPEPVDTNPRTDPDEPVHGDPEPAQPRTRQSAQQAIQDAIKAKMQASEKPAGQTLFDPEEEQPAQ